MIDVNIKGVLNGIAAVLPYMKAQQSGQIINTSSVAGHKVFTGSAVYDAKKRPVMFYNHGGGCDWLGWFSQDGANLARNFDVVVIETNHRLGLPGFLYLDEIAGPEYTGSGNMGLLDITEGLKWVNKNIAHFGGDPSNVIIWGESGGGAKTSCLYAIFT